MCFREAMLPLLARQQLGFFYNMPIVSVLSAEGMYIKCGWIMHFLQVNGCYGSGFFNAFTHHVLWRLKIKQLRSVRARRKIRVTLLSRTTKYRRMLNEDEVQNSLFSRV